MEMFQIVPVNDVSTLANALADIILETSTGVAWMLIASGATNPLNGASASVRVFASAFGVPEDPATGSGGANAAAYMDKYEFLGSNIVDIFVDQGYFVKPQPSPSLLAYKATSDPAGPNPLFTKIRGTFLERDWSLVLGGANLLKIQ